MNAQQQKLVEQITHWQADMVNLTRAVAEINSGSLNRDGIESVIDFFDDLFLDICDSQQRIALPPLNRVNNRGDTEQSPLADAAVYSIRPEAPVQVLCTGHTDTVFPATSQFQSTWIEGEHLRGPGVADMKGGLVVLYHALKAIHQSPFAEQLGFTVLLSPDEEIGSPRSAALLAEYAGRADVGLVYEPALFDGTLAGARKGSGNFDLTVKGVASHAGREFFAGRNAIVAATGIAQRLAELSDQCSGITVNIGRIDGGGAVNVVPDRAVIRFNVRIDRPEQQASVLADINEIIAACASASGCEVELNGHFGRPPKVMDDKQQALFEQLKRCGQSLGVDVAWRSTGGCCEGNNLAAAGLANIDTLGVRGGSIHSADEFACLDSFVERTQLNALLMSELHSHVKESHAKESHVKNSHGKEEQSC